MPGTRTSRLFLVTLVAAVVVGAAVVRSALGWMAADDDPNCDSDRKTVAGGMHLLSHGCSDDGVYGWGDYRINANTRIPSAEGVFVEFPLRYIITVEVGELVVEVHEIGTNGGALLYRLGSDQAESLMAATQQVKLSAGDSIYLANVKVVLETGATETTIHTWGLNNPNQ